MLVSVLDYIERAAGQHPDKPAFVEADREITYAEFLRRVKKRAYALMAQGYERQLRPRPVIVMQDKGIEALISFFAIAWTGNIYVPFDVNAPEERLAKITALLDPLLAITEEAHREKILSCMKGAPVITVAEADTAKDLDEALLAESKRRIIDTDPVYIICTSGSTGIPKGVCISHRAVLDFTEEASGCMAFSSEEKFLSQSPFYFDLSVFDIYCTLRNAATLHLVPRQYFVYPAKLVRYIAEHEINALIWVPSALILVANLRLLDDIDVTCLKKIMFCGEVMPNKQLNIWRRAVPDARYVNYYGPAETTCASTYYIVDRKFEDDEPLPIGKPAYNTGILILDDEDKAAGPGEIGELCIKGSGVGLGYYNDSEKTRNAFTQNPLNPSYDEKIYRTGDLVRINERGELLYAGRKDHQIKHMGYRIELGEIETAANSLAGVTACCCLYDEKNQQILLIYAGTPDENAVNEGVRQKVPRYMFPQKIIRTAAMPLNANGKINRILLAETYGKA